MPYTVDDHRAATKDRLDALPPPLNERAICKGCPHPAECRGKPCLNDIARPFLQKNQQSPLMMPDQARAVAAMFREGQTKIMITSGKRGYGRAFCSHRKFVSHCEAYPLWGAEMKAMAAVNCSKNKGSTMRNGTHCKRGHELPTEPNMKGHNGRMYVRCLICNAEMHKRGKLPNEEIIGKVMVQLILKRTIGSFTGTGQPGYILPHRNFTVLRQTYPEIDRLYRQIIDARKNLPKKKKVYRAKPKKLKPNDRSNVSVKLTGVIAAQPDSLHSALESVVSKKLPIEMRNAIINDMWIAVKEGAVALEELPKAVDQFKTSYNRMFPTKYAPISLDAPAFRDGATPLIETISETEGLW